LKERKYRTFYSSKKQLTKRKPPFTIRLVSTNKSEAQLTKGLKNEDGNVIPSVSWSMRGEWMNVQSKREREKKRSL
jgi:hypothetical protein